MKNYVVGFMFDPQGKNVVLIKKEKPEWQGFFNGVGGKIEEGEASEAAMSREFYEETGVSTFHSEWTKYANMSGPDWSVDVYYTFSLKATLAVTTTEERVSLVNTDAVAKGLLPIIPNLKWLTALAIDSRFQHDNKLQATVGYFQ